MRFWLPTPGQLLVDALGRGLRVCWAWMRDPEGMHAMRWAERRARIYRQIGDGEAADLWDHRVELHRLKLGL